MNSSPPQSPFDEFIRAAVTEFQQEELEQIPTKKELDTIISPSPNFFLRMKKLIRSQKKTHSKKKSVKLMQRAAVFLLLFLSLTGSLILINQDVRASLQNFFKQIYSEYINITFFSDNNNKSQTINYLDYLPEYMPEGYELTEISGSPVHTLILYSNEQKDTIFYSIFNKSSVYNIDKEHTTFKSISIYGQQVELYLSQDGYADNLLLYPLEKEPLVIIIRGPISESELIKIVESIISK